MVLLVPGPVGLQHGVLLVDLLLLLSAALPVRAGHRPPVRRVHPVSNAVECVYGGHHFQPDLAVSTVQLTTSGPICHHSILCVIQFY